MNKDSLLIMMWKNKLPDVALIKALFDLLFLIFVDFRSWDQICDQRYIDIKWMHISVF